MTPRVCRLALIATGLACATSASAQYTWTGIVSSGAGLAANWNPGTAPNVNQDVIVSDSSINVMDVADSWVRNGTGNTTVSGNAVVNIRTTGTGRLINRGNFDMTGGTINHLGQFFLVGSGGVGTFNHSGGTINSKVTAGWHLSDNNINQSGSSFNMSGDAVLNVEHTAEQELVHLRHIWFGKGGEAGANGGSAAIGNAPGDIFSMTGGTANFRKTADNPAKNSDVRVSRNSGMLISGGSATFTDFSEFIIGHGPSGGLNSRVIVSGGAVNLVGGTPTYIGMADNGLLEISGGTFTTDAGIMIGRLNQTGQGKLLMKGGNLTCVGLLCNTGSLEFTGGTIRLKGFEDQTAIIDEPWFIRSAAPREVIATYNSTEGYTEIRLADETGPVDGFSAWISGFTGLADATLSGDPDADGISNLLEFVLNSDPGAPSSASLPVADTTDAANLVYTFTRRADSKEGFQQIFQYGTDVVTWNDIVIPSATADGVEITTLEGGLESVRITLPKSNEANGRIFVRLMASDALPD